MSETEAPPGKTDRRAPLDIWREVRRVVCTLFDVSGRPEEMATRHTLTLKDHQLCVKWLRGVEALIRRMLFIEAALTDVSPASNWQTAAGKALAVRDGRRVEHNPAHPDTWRVCFRTLPCRSKAESRGSFEHATQTPQPSATMDPGSSRLVLRPRSVAPKFRSAWPLAERMEAVLRVFNNPAPYAKRLARRLRAKSALVQRICVSWDEARDTVGRTLFDVLINPIACSVVVFDTG